MKKIIIKNAKKDLISRKHHWIFSGAIHKKDPSIVNMDQVEVIDSQQNFLCQGLYHDASISVRIFSFDKSEDINSQAFWNNRLQNASSLRECLNLPNEHTNLFRLIHGEGDGLPGLVIDIYNDHAVIQLHYPGIEPFLSLIETALQSLSTAIQKVVIKKTYSKTPEDNQLESDILIAKENDIKFEIDLVNGQKTGFFIDQRENRALVGSISKNKSVLNLFAYNGGFSMYALKAGASQVCSIDISTKAIESLERNIKLNHLSTENHKSVVADVMEYVHSEPLNQDIIIVDPPAFAKHKSKRHNAIQAYKRLNSKVFKNAKAGALVFTFSCSQVITKDIFRNTIYSAALDSGRSIKVIKELNQGYDHPVNIYHPETDYLKGLMLYIQ